ncbi:hypothetical protein HDU76_009004 [Blyttiomyces sp. JEL0837]|nr:hypothetical protein HDU76_009004 [Blyttiomyces sp. JEL0837]
MSTGVIVYSSDVSGSVKVRKDTSRIVDILTAKKIPFQQIDVSIDEDAKLFMQSVSQKNTLPQIFSNGQYKGGFEQLDEANEDGLLKEWLGVE